MDTHFNSGIAMLIVFDCKMCEAENSIYSFSNNKTIEIIAVIYR